MINGLPSFLKIFLFPGIRWQTLLLSGVVFLFGKSVKGILQLDLDADMFVDVDSGLVALVFDAVTEVERELRFAAEFCG